MQFYIPPNVQFHTMHTQDESCAAGPQLGPIDKGDKEVIKFCHLWQASDKAEFCHCYVDTSQGVDKEVRAL